jgi:plastocyanin
MRWSLLLAAVLLVAPLVGCASDQASDGPGEGDDQEISYEVAWEDEPGDREAGEPIGMTWQVDGPDGEIPHTGVHYADFSVDDPESPADYGNTSGAIEPAQAPGSFDTEVTFDEAGTYYVRAHAIVPADGEETEHHWTAEVEVEVSESEPVDPGVVVEMETAHENGTADANFTFEWSLTGAPSQANETHLAWGSESTDDPTPTAYPNEAGLVENASVPGNYNATLSGLEPGTYHARAYALHDGSHYWSDEVAFNVTEPEEPAREEHNVAIEGFDYAPDQLTVHPGDWIVWENRDSATHTVTFDNETLGDSGDIGPGETYNLTVPEDIDEGTYDYVCNYHGTMTASVTVETD